MYGFQSRLFIILLMSVQLTAQYQSNENIVTKPQYNVSSERFFTDKGGTILMNVNVWGHVNRPGRHMVFDGIDIATLLSVVGGPKSGAELKKVKIFREVPDENGQIIYTINIAKFLKTGDRSEFIKIMPNDTFIIPQKTSSYMMEQVGTINTVLSILNIYLQIDYRNNQ
jgi:protein involved in polysaccharide export with SLBB domain